MRNQMKTKLLFWDALQKIIRLISKYGSPTLLFCVVFEQRHNNQEYMTVMLPRLVGLHRLASLARNGVAERATDAPILPFCIDFHTGCHGIFPKLGTPYTRIQHKRRIHHASKLKGIQLPCRRDHIIAGCAGHAADGGHADKVKHSPSTSNISPGAKQTVFIGGP